MFRRYFERLHLRRLRAFAEAIQQNRSLVMTTLHARRDRCAFCTMIVFQHGSRTRALIPIEYRSDQEWFHRRIDAPAMRLMARIDDQAENDDQ